MEIFIIHNDPIASSVFQHAVSTFDGRVRCTIVGSGKKAVIQLLQPSSSPFFICISTSLTDIKCRALINFIRKQAHLKSTKIIVLSNYFSPAELKSFAALDIEACLTDPGGLKPILEKART